MIDYNLYRMNKKLSEETPNYSVFSRLRKKIGTKQIIANIC